MALWSSLRDPKRVRDVLAETSGNLYTSNSLSRIGEAFAALIGSGTGIRDAFNDNKVSNTTDEEHERSSVLTGAAYKVFTQIYDKLKSEKARSQGADSGRRYYGTPGSYPITSGESDDWKTFAGNAADKASTAVAINPVCIQFTRRALMPTLCLTDGARGGYADLRLTTCQNRS
jgi:hypothetical protein